MYGWHAFNARNGFTSAQGLLNAFETGMYFWYLYVLYKNGHDHGRVGGKAVLVGFSAAVMTLSKTVLYCMFLKLGLSCWDVLTGVLGANEYYSGFAHIGHNCARDLVFLWIIPK